MLKHILFNASTQTHILWVSVMYKALCQILSPSQSLYKADSIPKCPKCLWSHMDNFTSTLDHWWWAYELHAYVGRLLWAIYCFYQHTTKEPGKDQDLTVSPRNNT